MGFGALDRSKPLRQQLFERIRAAGFIARVDLARTLGISPATVTTVAAELIAAGFIEEVSSPRPDGEAARGRPPVALGIRAEARLVAGISLTEKADSAIVIDLAGNRIATANRVHNRARRDFDAIIAAAYEVLEAVLAEAGLPLAAISAVGVCLPGLIDIAGGQVLWSPLIEGGKAPLQSRLEIALGRAVRVDNDANVVTMAELWFGAGRSLSDFAVVTIEEGIGMGLVLDHQIYRGASGLGMELAHTKVQLDGALCRCGQRGCLEAYIADYALVREARTALNLGNRPDLSSQVLLEKLFLSAKDGNRASRSIFRRAGRFLALGLANVVNILDPKVILLSGERLRYDYLYAEEVLAEMRALTLSTGRRAPKVEIHAWGEQVWARGAAALALEATTAEALCTMAAAE